MTFVITVDFDEIPFLHIPRPHAKLMRAIETVGGRVVPTLREQLPGDQREGRLKL